MRFPLGEMTVGDILDRGLKLLFARLPAFYALYLFMLAPVILLQLVIPFLLEAMINDLNAAGAGQGGAAFDPTNLILFFAVYMLAMVLTIVLVTIGNAAVLHIIMEEYQGNRVGVGSALGYALGRFFPLLGVSLLFGLMVGVGILFCCVPGFYLLATYMFVTQVVVLERRGVGEALTRSAELADGYRWRVLGVYLLVTLVSGFAQGFVVQVLGFVLPGQEMIPGPGGRMQIKVNVVNSIINTVVGNLVSIVFSAYLAVCVTLLYLDLRIRKEGFDLELAALRGEEGEFDPPPRRRRPRDEDDDYDDDDRPRRRRDEDDDDDDDDRGRR